MSEDASDVQTARYVIALALDAETLERTVNHLIDQGYVPIGGVQLTSEEWENSRKGYRETNHLWTQAVWKP